MSISAASFAHPDHSSSIEELRAQVSSLLSLVVQKGSVFLPFSLDEIFAGRFSGDVEDSPKIMPIVRTINYELNRMIRGTPLLNGAGEGLVRFSQALNDLVYKRHHIEQLNIFEVTPRSVSGKFLQNLIDVEHIYPFAGGIRDADIYNRTSGNKFIYALRDPYDEHGALITVSIALTAGWAKSIPEVFKAAQISKHMNTATPYTVTSWEKLSSIGKFFMYAVAEKIYRERHYIHQVVTISPMRGLRAYVNSEGLSSLNPETELRAAANYIVEQIPRRGKLVSRDLPARQHMGENGAELVRINRRSNLLDAEALYYTANYQYHSPQQAEINIRSYREGRPARSSEIDRLLQHAHPA